MSEGMFSQGVIRKEKRNPTNYKFSKLSCCRLSTASNLPKKYSIKSGFPKVYSQRYGNCTSNAVLACDDYCYHGPDTNWLPSTTFTYYNQRVMMGADVNKDEGSSVECALDAVRKYGACAAKIWPNDKPFNEKPSKEAYENGLKGQEIYHYYAVDTVLQVKKALSLGYPVVGGFSWPVTRSVCDKNFVLSEITKKEANKCMTGHAIVIVGYDDKTKMFEFRNSWGEKWGNNGYAYVSYQNFKNRVFWEDVYAVVK